MDNHVTTVEESYVTVRHQSPWWLVERVTPKSDGDPDRQEMFAMRRRGSVIAAAKEAAAEIGLPFKSDAELPTPMRGEKTARAMLARVTASGLPIHIGEEGGKPTFLTNKYEATTLGMKEAFMFMVAVAMAFPVCYKTAVRIAQLEGLAVPMPDPDQLPRPADPALDEQEWKVASRNIFDPKGEI